MFDYMTVQEAATKWGISERRIQKLCEENRILGVVRLSRVWLIPKDAEKPADGRCKQNRKTRGYLIDKKKVLSKEKAL